MCCIIKRAMWENNSDTKIESEGIQITIRERKNKHDNIKH